MPWEKVCVPQFGFGYVLIVGTNWSLASEQEDPHKRSVRRQTILILYKNIVVSSWLYASVIMKLELDVGCMSIPEEK